MCRLGNLAARRAGLMVGRELEEIPLETDVSATYDLLTNPHVGGTEMFVWPLAEAHRAPWVRTIKGAPEPQCISCLVALWRNSHRR